VAKVEEAFDDLEGCLADLLAVCECHLETHSDELLLSEGVLVVKGVFLEEVQDNQCGVPQLVPDVLQASIQATFFQ